MLIDKSRCRVVSDQYKLMLVALLHPENENGYLHDSCRYSFSIHLQYRRQSVWFGIAERNIGQQKKPNRKNV